MTRESLSPIALAVALVLASSLLLVALDSPPAFADNGARGRFAARLTGNEEAPSILTPARGLFEAKVSNDGASVDYRLRYTGFATDVLAAHIHIGQVGVNGGVAVFLCGGGSAPACTAVSGDVMGTFVATDVLAIPAQGLEAGNLAKVLKAIRDGVAYVNVHSTAFTGGEIRGQIGRGRGPGGGGD